MYRIKIADSDGLEVQEWNELLMKSEICDAFQTYEWAQVLRSSLGVEPYFVMVYDEGDLVGGVMYFKKKALGMLVSYEVRGGPLCSDANKLQVMKSILRALGEKRKKAAYMLFVPFPLANLSFSRIFRGEGYHPIVFRTLIVDLDRPIDDVWKALDKYARRGVRRARKLGVEASVARTWEEWKEYYRLHLIHARENGYPPEPHRFYEEMFKLHRKKMARLFVSKLENRIIAGTLCLIYRENLVGIRGASLSEFLKYQPNNLAHWKSIEWAKENGVKIYDFDGLPLEQTEYLRGVYKYKSRWDGSVQWYHYYVNNGLLPPAIHLVRTSFQASKLFSTLRHRNIIPT